MSRMIAGAAALILAASGMTADARPLKPEQEAKIKPAGPAENCIPLRSIRNTRVRDDRTIDFYMTGGKVYRNVLPQSCPGLGFEERFGYATSLSQLCSVDIITVLRTPPVPQGASCGLGKFQPITGAPK
ncbi:hypothetical protein GG804_04785 [Sphingomonas histidinilytica]|uniref:Uncharacterized protein n=1 Tax=Rhizorhabdus histidinilytica TaxID=439228 RepID=A0A1T5A1P1_9SPHN|nr:hypothetical protein [Rhizorhabdus histidinilytica]MBO9376071.1 hypothetical protein [Rhizorhabdus histidinilytica]QEH78362.1 hypothetical protein EIK56_09410 [Sphingomonas sp. C8-2]SKB28689.1 hypothetical protein SAMN06295920_101462 [Rhizorhabdus histidinilytica]